MYLSLRVLCMCVNSNLSKKSSMNLWKHTNKTINIYESTNQSRLHRLRSLCFSLHSFFYFSSLFVLLNNWHIFNIKFYNSMRCICIPIVIVMIMIIMVIIRMKCCIHISLKGKKGQFPSFSILMKIKLCGISAAQYTMTTTTTTKTKNYLWTSLLFTLYV